MERPGSRIVLVPLHDNKVAWKQHLHISTLRIGRVRDGAVPAVPILSSCTLSVRGVSIAQAALVPGHVACLTGAVLVAEDRRVRSTAALR